MDLNSTKIVTHNTLVSNEFFNLIKKYPTGDVLSPIKNSDNLSVLSPALLYIEPDYDVGDIICFINKDSHIQESHYVVVTGIALRPVNEYFGINNVNENFIFTSNETTYNDLKSNPWAWIYSYELADISKYKVDSNRWIVDVNFDKHRYRYNVIAHCPKCGNFDCISGEHQGYTLVKDIHENEIYVPMIYSSNYFGDVGKDIRNILIKKAEDTLKRCGYHYCPKCGEKLI